MNTLQRTVFGSFFAVTYLYSSLTFGYDHEWAQDHLADDVAQCAAYYSLFQVEAIQSNEQRTARELEPTVNAANTMLMTLENNNIEKSKAKLKASLEMETGMVRNEGWARLILRYSDFCKQLLEHPEIRMNYWEKR